MSTLHKIAMQDIRKRLDKRPAADDQDEEDAVSVRILALSYIWAINSRLTQPTLEPESSRSTTKFQHIEEAKRANTNFENWIAQWNALYHKAIAEDVGEVKGIARADNVFDAIGARVDPVWTSVAIREIASQDYKPTDDFLHWLSFLSTPVLTLSLVAFGANCSRRIHDKFSD
ncbi:hypothetical protein E4U32_007613 [Claviceps aff. humidiphila group G2b]|nr:hypothetical protein E4U32_007613 [Claviceps aff. humidiphila group G2b]